MDGREYIERLLGYDDAESAVRADMPRLLTVIPELRDTVGFEHRHPHHHKDVWEHTLLALSFSKNQLVTRLALLLHDVGKPTCCQQEGEIRHFRGHPRRSAELAEAILCRLGFDRALSDRVTELVRRHDTPLSKKDIARDPELSAELFEVQRCDALAHDPSHNERRMKYIEEIRRELKI